MFVKANGIRINYTIDGSKSAPWVVMSNSLMTDLSSWDLQARGCRVFPGAEIRPARTWCIRSN